MNDVLAMIMAGGNGERLHPLTRERAKPAIPFGGIYRLIDFTLSNCINSGVGKIAVLTQYKFLSLHMHLRLGWSSFCSEPDKYVIPISPQMKPEGCWYRGTADSIYQNLDFADTVNPKYFLILSADHIYKMNYRTMLEFHKERQADVTVAATAIDRSAASQFGVIKVNGGNRIIRFEEKPQDMSDLSPHRTLFANMGVYIFNGDILREFLEEDSRRDTYHDFGKNIIPEMIPRVSVLSYNFRDEHTGRPEYWRDVGTIDAYFEACMDLVGSNPEFNLYDEHWPIHTYQGQYPPAKVTSSGDRAGSRSGVCLNSIISGGCIISRGRVQDSILSPRVQIGSDATVLDSILMEGVHVGHDCKIRRTIIDQDVNIPPGMEIGYDLEEDGNRFFVSRSGVAVIAKGMKISSSRRETPRVEDTALDSPLGASNWQ